MADDFVAFYREQFSQAVAAELPQVRPEIWLSALQKLLANRAAPGTAAQQSAKLPELRLLARTIKFGMDDSGLRVMAEPPGDKTLTLLRRGGLWFRGGDVEAELLSLLSELRS